MDLWQIGATVLGFVLSITAVGAAVAKFVPKAMKIAVIAKDAIDLVYDVLDAVKDGKIDQAELDEIKKHADALKVDFKLLLGK